MRLMTIGLGTLYVTLASTATICLTQTAASQTDIANVGVTQSIAVTDDANDWAPNYEPPAGVPPELHRKVIHLYKRIHNAYPDASRQRVFNKIAEELGIHPQRLWSVYHSGGEGTGDPRDLLPSDRVSDQRLNDRAVSDRAIDRPSSIDRATARLDRPVRDRPQRDRPTRD